MSESKQAYPLQWPEGWKRTSPAMRSYARFNTKETVHGGDSSWKRKKDVTVFGAVERIIEQLQRMGINENDVVISTNIALRLDGRPRSDQKAPADPGVAVYWREGGKPMRCMAIDRYSDVAGNLAAVAATLDAMRAIERHGGAEVIERAFTGFAALSDGNKKPWRDILGIKQAEVTMQTVDDAFRQLARLHHPDAGGQQERFQEINQAREDARAELGRTD